MSPCLPAFVNTLLPPYLNTYLAPFILPPCLPASLIFASLIFASLPDCLCPTSPPFLSEQLQTHDRSWSIEYRSGIGDGLIRRVVQFSDIVEARRVTSPTNCVHSQLPNLYSITLVSVVNLTLG